MSISRLRGPIRDKRLVGLDRAVSRYGKGSIGGGDASNTCSSGLHIFSCLCYRGGTAPMLCHAVRGTEGGIAARSGSGGVGWGVPRKSVVSPTRCWGERGGVISFRISVETRRWALVFGGVEDGLGRLEISYGSTQTLLPRRDDRESEEQCTEWSAEWDMA